MKTLSLLLIGLSTFVCARAETYPASETFTHSYPVSAQAELSLSNVNGSVEIVAWDKNEVALEAEKRCRTSEDLPKIQIEVDATSNRVVISTHYERTGWGWFGRSVSGAVHYKLRVPTGIALRKIDVVNSNITIRDVSGEVEASSVNGSIRATGLASSAHLKTVNGNIEVSLASATGNRTIHTKTVNGSCKLALPDAIAADVEASTVNGHVKCDFPINALTSTRTKLQGQIGQGKEASIEARSVNGNIAFNRQ
jgi:Putative adhesin